VTVTGALGKYLNEVLTSHAARENLQNYLKEALGEEVTIIESSHSNTGFSIVFIQGEAKKTIKVEEA
jgi:hypothetical protein